MIFSSHWSQKLIWLNPQTRTEGSQLSWTEPNIYRRPNVVPGKIYPVNISQTWERALYDSYWYHLVNTMTKAPLHALVTVKSNQKIAFHSIPIICDLCLKVIRRLQEFCFILFGIHLSLILVEFLVY